jgi:hypothetical protein
MKRAILTAAVLCLCVFAAAALPAKNLPGKILLGSLSSQYEAVAFDHAAHVKTAGTCGECHHQHGTERILSCRECHNIDPAAFKKAVVAGNFRPCRECHAAAYNAARTEVPTLKAAYHRACIRCHREVGSVGKDPKGCTEMCHDLKRQAKN